MSATDVLVPLYFVSREDLTRAREHGPRSADYRTPDRGARRKVEKVECLIHDARPNSAEFALETSGFTLVRRPSGVRDWFDNDEVMRVYYDECKELARELTGASHAFTFDHLIREPGRQTGGGGLLKKHEVTTPERGGGYVSVVHMDYTDNSTWGEYLSLYGFSEPQGASGVVALNFWRPLFNTAERERLRSVRHGP